MATKHDNLPLNMETTDHPGSSITYANEVIAIIAGVAASEVEGIAGMSPTSGISDILGRNRNITRGVKVEIGPEEASVDLYIIVEYGTPIQQASRDAQESVRKAIESMTGLKVVRVDVHVQGVSFEKENLAISAGREKAALPAGKGKGRKQTQKATQKATATDESAPEAADAVSDGDNQPAETMDDMVAEATESVENAAEAVDTEASEAAKDAAGDAMEKEAEPAADGPTEAESEAGQA